MNITPLALRAGVAGLRLSEWADRRLQERSTIIGLAGLAATLGFSTIGGQITAHAEFIMMAAGALSTGLVTASTKPRPPELVIAQPILAPPPSPVPPTPEPTKEGTTMFFITVARKVFGIIAVAVAPTWNKGIANALAQAEATLVPLLGDDAKKLCEDVASTTDSGFTKLANVVSDLAKIAADKGIKADFMVLTVIAAKAYAQIKADAPALLDVAIETGITAAAGPAVGALAAPLVEAGVAAAIPTPAAAA